MKDLCQYGNRPEDEWEILPWIPDPRPPFKIWAKPEQIAPFFLIRINRITISAGTSGLLLSFCSAAVSCIMPQKASFLKTFCHKLPDFT